MITLERILIPTDFSESSGAAAQYAVDLARKFGASLHVLHVLDRREPLELGPEFPLSLDDDVQNEAKKRLNGTLTDEERKSLSVNDYAMRVGTPSVEIVRYAKDHDIDLIVMGTHGGGVVTRVLMGSVAEEVVRKAECPVLTVRAANSFLPAMREARVNAEAI